MKPIKRIKEIVNDNDIKKVVIKECKRLISSGGIDFDTSNYRDAKIVLSAALYNISHQYYPFTKEDQEACENLKHF